MFPSGASIYVLEIANTDILEVTPSGIWADSPMWLDDTHLVFRSRIWARGAEIAYAHERSGYEAQNIAIVNTNSGEVIQLTDIVPPSPFVISCPFTVPQDVGEQIASP